MRKTFWGYYRPTDDEFDKLWQDAFIIPDANVLLSMYHYSPQTSSEVLKLFTKISKRLWVPYQAAFEYHKNRISKIKDQKKAYEDIITLLNTTENLLKDKLSDKTHPYLENSNEIKKKLNRFFSAIKQDLEIQKEKHMNLMKEDSIRETISQIFEGRVGPEYSNTDLEKIYKEGITRYENKVPPGYKDDKKEDSKYGDLIIWFQIIDEAKKRNLPAILITNDAKEDWWSISDGRTIGPRPELIQEFQRKVGLPCYLYRAEAFLENTKKYYKESVQESTLKEIKDKSNISVLWRDELINLQLAKNYLESFELLNRMSEKVTPINNDFMKFLMLHEQMNEMNNSSSNAFEELIKYFNNYMPPQKEQTEKDDTKKDDKNKDDKNKDEKNEDDKEKEKDKDLDEYFKNRPGEDDAAVPV